MANPCNRKSPDRRLDKRLVVRLPVEVRHYIDLQHKNGKALGQVARELMVEGLQSKQVALKS